MKAFLNIIWQLPQFLTGELVYLCHKLFIRNQILRPGVIRHNNSFAAKYLLCSTSEKNRIKGFSLGCRIFLYYDTNTAITEDRLQEKIKESIKHEYGHTVQSKSGQPHQNYL